MDGHPANGRSNLAQNGFNPVAVLAFGCFRSRVDGVFYDFPLVQTLASVEVSVEAVIVEQP
jgi:hypothetical protein